MKRALLLAAVLAAPGVAWGQDYKPDFNCSADHSKDSIATMLCQNSEAAKHELIFDQTYYALRQIVGKSGWKSLKQEVIADDDALKECVAPVAPSLPDVAPQADATCYIVHMDAITDKYKARLTGAALEEANRPIDRHIEIQQKLIDLGYLRNTSTADGVYGESTREAILNWQDNRSPHQPSGFISDDDADLVLDPYKDNSRSASAHKPQSVSFPSREANASSQPLTTKPAEHEGGGGFGVMLLIPIIIGSLAAFIHSRNKKTYDLTWSLVEREIRAQKKNLQIARTQKLVTDAYGTVQVSMWSKEIGYFLDTRISPIIDERISDQKKKRTLRVTAIQLIERLASEPLETSAGPAYRSDPTTFDPRMNPFDYEQYCALLLRGDGWDAQATQKSGDQGADVIAQKNGVKIVVQCKLYTGTVGNDAVQQAYTAQTFQGAQAAIVATNSTFSTSARQAAATTGVCLIHHAQLVDTADEILRRLSVKTA
ncbi:MULTISPECIES: restriction endonuclease [Acetobacter]|uniref:Restriction endonuclease type IV Mrr domain-containing protein n=1 Tax=Acetobacter tropicalis TaxID=104102 RepID=A0A291PGX0_9PROT|nr:MULTISPECIES: restriction endonuclease [Acetobacter]ATJ90637.1 hypothetical protein CIW82_08025 [Acetobacter tropicalis]